MILMILHSNMMELFTTQKTEPCILCTPSSLCFLSPCLCLAFHSDTNRTSRASRNSSTKSASLPLYSMHCAAALIMRVLYKVPHKLLHLLRDFPHVCVRLCCQFTVQVTSQSTRNASLFCGICDDSILDNHGVILL
jgi:hypothetical protein